MSSYSVKGDVWAVVEIAHPGTAGVRANCLDCLAIAEDAITTAKATGSPTATYKYGEHSATVRRALMTIDRSHVPGRWSIAPSYANYDSWYVTRNSDPMEFVMDPNRGRPALFSRENAEAEAQRRNDAAHDNQ